jgi:hypothetical protein
MRIKEEYEVFKHGPADGFDQMYADLVEHGQDPANLLPALTRMRNATDTLQASVTRISRWNEGVIVYGMVLYIGDDQAARQASSIVVGDLCGREVLQEHFVEVQTVVNGVADTVWYV